MNILVLGAGAIGSVFGGLLSEVGHTVFLLCRDAHKSEISRSGLKIDGIWGTHTVKNLLCETSLEEIIRKSDKNFDIVLLSVKSYDTESMIKSLKEHIPNTPRVVSLQNGLGNVEIIESVIGSQQTIGARVIFGVETVRPGHVRVTVCADATAVGGLTGKSGSNFLYKLAAFFSEAGIETVVTDEIEKFIWEKVLYNCSLNGLATILDVNYGQLMFSSEAKHIMENIIEEVFDVARCEGVTLGWESPVLYRDLLFNELIPKTFEHHPSMLQDIRRQRRTEIDALNGAIVRIGRKYNLELPANWSITQLIKAREICRA